MHVLLLDPFLCYISLGPTGCPASLPSSPEAAPCGCSSPSAQSVAAPCGCSSPLDSLPLWRAALSNEGRGRESCTGSKECD